MLRLTYDRAAGLVRLVSGGFLTVDEVRDYQRELETVVARARADSGRLKLLIDSTDSPVQSAEVIAEFQRQPTSVTEPQDRMAVIVSSSLAKMQMKRNFRSDKEQAFVSEDAALTWLLAN